MACLPARGGSFRDTCWAIAVRTAPYRGYRISTGITYRSAEPGAVSWPSASALRR